MTFVVEGQKEKYRVKHKTVMAAKASMFPFSCLASGERHAATKGTAVQPSQRPAVTAPLSRSRTDEDRPIRVNREEYDAARIVSVPLTGWETQKAKRVDEAFHRIVEKEWFDKFESNLKAVEQVHVNAVREHFAMRRDKIKTPDVRCRKGSNAIGREEWARNVEALNYLTRDTNVGTFFRGLAGKQRAQRLAKAAGSRQHADSRDVSDAAEDMAGEL